MDLKVDFNKLTTKDEAYNAVKQAITPEMLAKFQVKADLTYNKDEILATGKGFELAMRFDETCCMVSVDLSFLLKAFKGKIIAGLEKQLKRVI